MQDGPKLFGEFEFGGHRIKNRVVVPPMADFGLTGPDGKITQRHIDHYVPLVEGGAGIVIVEACAVGEVRERRFVRIPGSDGATDSECHRARIGRDAIDLSSDDCLPELTVLAESIVDKGALVLVQLYSAGLDYMDVASMAEIPFVLMVAYQHDFLFAARRCKEAGFDGIELHAAHDYFLNQLIERNDRTDAYGGDLEGRARFVCELVRMIKRECGEDFVVSVRLGEDDTEELADYARMVEHAGADLLHVSWGLSRFTGVPADWPWAQTVYAASVVRKNVGIPVICVEGIEDSETAEEILQAGAADLVAVGRGHLCDPAWARKSQAGEKPNPCRHCRHCQWFADGRRCPAVLAL